MESAGIDFVGEVGQKAFIIREDTVLMVQALGEPGWDFPGGRLQEGEAPHEGLQRELHEELGLRDVVVGQPFHVIPTTTKAGGNKLMIVYACTMSGAADFVLKEDEIADVRWIAKSDMTHIDMHLAWRNILDAHFSSRS